MRAMVWVSAAPLQALARERMARGEMTLGAFAERVGRTRRTVMRFMDLDRITFFTADRYCTALGLHISDVYPLETRRFDDMARYGSLERMSA